MDRVIKYRYFARSTSDARAGTDGSADGDGKLFSSYSVYSVSMFYVRQYFPYCIVPSCLESRWSRPAALPCTPRTSEKPSGNANVVKRKLWTFKTCTSAKVFYSKACNEQPHLHGIRPALVVEARRTLAVLQNLLEGSLEQAVGHLVAVAGDRVNRE